MTIGQLAKSTETDQQTIRYYESIGVLPAAQRNKSGYRIYDGAAVDTLGFIRRAKTAGFTLSEIKTLIGLADGSLNRCADVRGFVEEKLSSVNKQLSQLTAIQRGLEELVGRCKTSDTVDTCPALRSLLYPTVGKE